MKPYSPKNLFSPKTLFDIMMLSKWISKQLQGEFDMNQEIFWEKEPATEWLSAYPIGNGRQGAMIFGGWEEERVQLNLDSLWYGGHVDRINPDARKNLATVRSLILNGKIKEAETLDRKSVV